MPARREPSKHGEHQVVAKSGDLSLLLLEERVRTDLVADRRRRQTLVVDGGGVLV
jgi:hypothetical protein